MNTTFQLDEHQFTALLEAIRGECAPPGLPQPWVKALQERAAKAEAGRDAYRCACTTLDKLRRAYGIRPDADPVAELDSRFECMERELVLALAKLRDARQDGIAQGVKWASAHPRIHRWDYQEPVTAYIERGIQEVGG